MIFHLFHETTSTQPFCGYFTRSYSLVGALFCEQSPTFSKSGFSAGCFRARASCTGEPPFCYRVSFQTWDAFLPCPSPLVAACGMRMGNHLMLLVDSLPPMTYPTISAMQVSSFVVLSTLFLLQGVSKLNR